MQDDLIGAALFTLAVGIYFLPTAIAYNRHHKNTILIFLFNILFGETILGWSIAMIWSASDNTKKQGTGDEKG